MFGKNTSNSLLTFQSWQLSQENMRGNSSSWRGFTLNKRYSLCTLAFFCGSEQNTDQIKIHRSSIEQNTSQPCNDNFFVVFATVYGYKRMSTWIQSWTLKRDNSRVTTKDIWEALADSAILTDAEFCSMYGTHFIFPVVTASGLWGMHFLRLFLSSLRVFFTSYPVYRRTTQTNKNSKIFFREC